MGREAWQVGASLELYRWTALSGIALLPRFRLGVFTRAKLLLDSLLASALLLSPCLAYIKVEITGSLGPQGPVLPPCCWLGDKNPGGCAL